MPTPEKTVSAPEKSEPVSDPAKLTEQDWKKRLTAEQFSICRLKGTERPGSGKYLDHWAPGTYGCVACGTPLFGSKAKYESGCGWPAFYEALPGAVSLEPGTDSPEATCAKCGSHLGHRFNDGPPPTGKRY